MPVVICMLRGVNVGAHNRVKMDDLKKLCVSLKLRDPQTYVQNIFLAKPEDYKPATQTIMHGGSQPSAVWLPVAAGPNR